MRNVAALCLLLLMVASCKKIEEDPELVYRYNYMPLVVGHEIIYDVDSIVYNYVPPVQDIDTIQYQYREVIKDTFYDSQGLLNYRFEYSRRNNAAENWKVDRVWFGTANELNFQKVEDDVRLIKLVFPPDLGLTWDGLAYAPPATGQFSYLSGWQFKVIDLNVPLVVNGNSFEETMTVQFVNEENLINKKLGREVYAYGVGLVYKEWEMLTKQRTTDNDWQRPENGFRIRMRVKSYTP